MSAPAYPHLAQSSNSYEAVQHCGLTKRELFAAMAMQGLLAPGTISFAHMRAAAAVELADALLAELAKDGAA